VAGNPEKYVFNNIFYVLDDRVVYRNDLASQGSRYDGNVIFRRQAGRMALFIRFGDGGDYQSLAGFRGRSGTAWEAHGLEVDPGFDPTAFDAPPVEGRPMWSRYQPTNPSVATPGARFGRVKWPGAGDLDYRGAVPPQSTAASAAWRRAVAESGGPLSSGW
jgi:hypothetical protein